MTSTDCKSTKIENTPDGVIGTVRRSAPIILYGFLSFIAVYPVLIVKIPLLADYPSHLAGIHIQTSIANSPDLQAHYELHWKPLPNLAMQFILPPLAKVFSLFDAGRIFIAAAILLPVAGVAVLRKVIHGRVGYAPAYAFLPAYNLVLAWGFLNFLFTSGLCLLAFAGWIASRYWRPLPRIALFSVVAIILYFAHLFAFATYAVLIAVYTIRSAPGPTPWRARRYLTDLAVAGAQFIGPALLLVPTLLSGRASYTDFNGWASRYRTLMSPAYSVGTPADLLLITLAALVLFWALRYKRLTLASEIRLPLIVLAVLAMFMPEWLMQTWGANLRLPIIAVFILLAGATLHLPAGRGRLAMAAVFFALFIARIGAVAEIWSDDARKIAEFRAAALSIPIGARVIPVQPPTSDTPELRGGFGQAYWGMTALLAIDRSAFVPTLFTDDMKQLLSVTAENALIDSPFGGPATPGQIQEGAGIEARGLPPRTSLKGYRSYWTDWPHRFDYMVALHTKASLDNLEPLLKPVHTGSFFTIYRIESGSCRPADLATPDQAPRVCGPDDDAASGVNRVSTAR